MIQIFYKFLLSLMNDDPINTWSTTTYLLYCHRQNYRNCNSRNLFARAWGNTLAGKILTCIHKLFFFSFAGCSGNPGFGTMFLVLYFHRWHCCTSDSKSGCMIVASWALVSATIDDQPQQLRMAGGMQDPKQLSKCQPEIYHFCC